MAESQLPIMPVLGEAKVEESLAYLYSMDPLKLTDENIEALAKNLWEQQERWGKVEEQEQKKPKGTRGKKVAMTAEGMADLSKALGLKL